MNSIQRADIILPYGRRQRVTARLAQRQIDPQLPLIVLTEGQDTPPDDCIINPPDLKLVFDALGLTVTRALIVLACRSAEHYDHYAYWDRKSPEFACWLSTDHQHKLFFEVRECSVDAAQENPKQIGALDIHMVEFLLGEPLGGFVQLLERPIVGDVLL